MYWLSMSITDGMMGYLQDAETPAVAWKNLARVFEVNTKARKLQLKSELNQVKRNNLSINDLLKSQWKTMTLSVHAWMV